MRRKNSVWKIADIKFPDGDSMIDAGIDGVGRLSGAGFGLDCQLPVDD